MSYHYHHEITIAPSTKLKPEVTVAIMEDREFWYHDRHLFTIDANGEFKFNEEHYDHSNRRTTYTTSLDGYAGEDDYLQGEDFSQFLKNNLIAGSVEIIETSEEGDKGGWRVTPGHRQVAVMAITFVDEDKAHLYASDEEE